MKKVVVLMGPPGSGKSTQVARVIDRYHLASVATGDLVRQAAENNPEIANIMTSGNLIDDQTITGLLKESFEHSAENTNIILDGYPRNGKQADILQKMLESEEMTLKIIVLEVSEAEILNRLGKRFICSKCKKVSNYSGQCECGGTFGKRQDDEEATIKQRLSIYNKNLDEIDEYYSRLGEIEKINGEGTFDEVTERIYGKLDHYFKDQG